MRVRHQFGRFGIQALAAAAAVALAVGGFAALSSDTATAAEPGSTVTVRPNPGYQGQPFEGWGTSLAWFAAATGDYPEPIRKRLADLTFGPDGLALNIARYNIGGGNAPDVPPYLRAGGAVEGWWRAPAGTTRADKDWWDPANPAHWNLEADRTQRWWVDAIKGRVTRWETFSNSPPWFQTVSGYVSGGFDASADQIRADRADAFAAYVVRVTKELERAHDISVATIAPLNEPNTPYWSTTLGSGGNPTGGRQEGAHAGPELQQAVLRAVAARLEATGSRTKVSAMDDTNPDTFVANWNAYGEQARSVASRLNVHTYGTGGRTVVRDIAKGEGKPLWMSEVEGSWGTGQSFTDMAPGLGMAQHIVDDLRELEPSAFVFWQPVEDNNAMKPTGSSAGLNWGSIQVPFDCTAKDTLATCPVRTNTKFDTIRNFTHYIRPGDRLLQTGDRSSIAALSSQRRLAVVHVNDTAAERDVVLDLSAFGEVPSGAKVTPVVSSADGALVAGTPVRLDGRTATLTVPASSVTTFVVDKALSGVESSARAVRPGRVYSLQGVGSGRSLTVSANGSGFAIRTDDAIAAGQRWTLKALDTATDARAQYVVETATGGRRLTATASGGLTTVTAADAAPAPAARWVLSSTGDGRWTFVNVGTRRLLDVGGGATADGSAVGLWPANATSHQLWRIVDVTG